MIRRFCDACHMEILESANRTTFKREFWPTPAESVEIAVEVLVSVNGAANGGEICLNCIKDTIDEGATSRRTMR